MVVRRTHPTDILSDDDGLGESVAVYWPFVSQLLKGRRGIILSRRRGDLQDGEFAEDEERDVLA